MKPKPKPKSNEQRLQRVLAQAGLASRRKAEDLIQAGRVAVDGKVVTQLGVKVDPDRQRDPGGRPTHRCPGIPGLLSAA